MKKVAILQSNYIPWKGYFDLINRVDEFILFDDMQYTKRDWRNRNKIKTSNGLQWLTIPVEVKGNYFQKIKDTKISDTQWNIKHWNSIKHAYAKANCFRENKDFLESLYQEVKYDYLSEVNYFFITAINQYLGIDTKISWSSDYELGEGKTERLVNLCLQAEATEYISGPAAKNYINKELFENARIKLSWMSYEGYPEYKQLYNSYEHGVSIVDMICNLGLASKEYMITFKP